MPPSKSIKQVQEEHTERWMNISGVVGTAIGKVDGEPCIKVLVARKTGELTDRLPDRVDGYRVVLKETGEIRPV